MEEIKIGDKVKKVKWYKFPWTVVSVYNTLSWEVRYVVEATGSDYIGMQHIFNREQLCTTE